ncbi:hypothetical protein QYF36_020440 [Acer negundo]|nr:hypothetical protein QYF36_020440 [Acer negundo]
MSDCGKEDLCINGRGGKELLVLAHVSAGVIRSSKGSIKEVMDGKNPNRNDGFKVRGFWFLLRCGLMRGLVVIFDSRLVISSVSSRVPLPFCWLRKGLGMKGMCLFGACV